MAKKQSPEQGGGSIRGVDLKEVQRLLAFMQTHGLEEFEYETADFHIRLKKASSASGGHPSIPARASEAAGTVLPQTPHVPAPSSAPVSGGHRRPSDASPAADVHVIKSPIVGTFYSAPSPDAGPFVTLGAKVDVGQVLCIIEAMKLMNEIESDAAGEIAEIFVENGKPVEYGESLFGIRSQPKK
jgi:acetyl-CoA carboxylase biotin carboxyl carrier protein